MASKMLYKFPRTTPSFLARSMRQRVQAIPPRLSRTYAGEASPQNTSNAANPQASSAESQSINKSRATDAMNQQDTGSVANPVSNPEQAGLGQQEEQTESQDHIFSDPKKSDAQKKEETLKFGQSKKLDAADK